jgi:rRNA maturation RNase YbeY
MTDEYPPPLSIKVDHSSLRLDRSDVERAIHHVLEAEEASLTHLSVVLSDHDTVRTLNQEYLDHDYNTDVLSFSLQSPGSADAGGVEGEIYVDLDTAAERHEEFDTTFEQEALRYVIHGLLHLVGYSDASEEGQSTMRSKEDTYLDAIASE